ncbi:MAG: phosphatase PAP2 family protein, partial [Chitinophagaceae bacterium]
MKKAIGLLSFLFLVLAAAAQTEPQAGTWKTWFIPSVRAYRLPPPTSVKGELQQVRRAQQSLDSAGRANILYWNAGAPGYRWHALMMGLWPMDTSAQGVLANMLLGATIYDATVAAWDTKYAYRRPRPFEADKSLRMQGPRPESPSYPCEYSVAAGAAVTVISHFYPAMKDSVTHMAARLMAARVAAGFAYPGDTAAGFALGQRIALKEIENTRAYVCREAWDHKIREGSDRWRGKFAMFPMAGHNRTVVLDSASEFRPGPPPDFAKDMAELKALKQNFKTMSNALYYASNFFWDDALNKKLFEYHLDQNPPRAAQIYALSAIANYDAFAACWDAKYTFWGIRPSQYDSTF